MEIGLLQMERESKDCGRDEVGEIKQELIYVMCIYQLPTMKLIITNFKHVPIKIKSK